MNDLIEPAAICDDLALNDIIEPLTIAMQNFHQMTL